MLARKVRRFHLERDVDVSGVSGTGVVAYGVQAPNGTCVLWWDSEHESIGIYPSMDTLLAIHGHSGSTHAVFVDDPAEVAEPAGTPEHTPVTERITPPCRAKTPTRTPAAGRAATARPTVARPVSGKSFTLPTVTLPTARGAAATWPPARMTAADG